VASLDLVEPGLVDVVRLELVVKRVEVEDMDLGALDGVFDHGAGLHDEGPVAGLSEQQLASGLVQRAAAQRVARRRMMAGQLHHAVGVFVEVAVEPVVGAFEPDFAVALVAPTGKGGLRQLDLGELVQVLGES